MRLPLILAAMVALAPGLAGAAGKVLFVNSYHQGYAWSDGEEAGAQRALTGSGVTLEFYRMDTKRNPDAKWFEDQSKKVRAKIDAEKPDVVIVADDNAARVMAKHYKNNGQKWVYCGVNWDPANHGLPYDNATGMTEVALVDKVIETLKGYAKGKRVGFLTVDSETEHTEARAYAKQLKLSFAKEKFVKTLAEWKDEFRKMQGEVDVLFFGNFAGINDWNEAEAAAWALEYSRIPSGSTYDFTMPYTMLGMTKIAEEQGVWAGKAALQIVKGAKVSSIPPTQNKDYQLFLNVKLASKAGVVFKPELLRNATVLK
ncbi:MAG TPA: ABC transporter substrate binding protein [Anaeromyxobacteraceae bacterium]|nr:ABC transporter substrate binding protein [Anaeromyxobacteraceae bacterium]